MVSAHMRFCLILVYLRPKEIGYKLVLKAL